MLCQNCNRNKATVKFTQIINGHKKEMMLCEKCSDELGINKMNFNMPIDFSSFFGGLLEGYEDSNFMPMLSGIKELKCDNCNTTYDEFINTGKLGCPKCYDAFEDRIDPILKRIHGSDRHLGKKPNKRINKNDIKQSNIKVAESEKDKLEKDLKKAIAEERYEDAAKIRDKIKSLKEE